MLYLIAAVFGAALLLALLRLRDHRRSVQGLTHAVLERRPLHREEDTGQTNDWTRLRSAVNGLIAEFVRLNRVRSDQLSQLESTLGSLQEAVLIVDGGNRVLLANKALQSIFPAAPNILNQRLEVILHSAEFLRYVDSVRAGKAEACREIEFIEDDHAVWLEVTGTLVTPLDDGPGPWALFVLHDITKQKNLEGIRKDFVANVSHELRTPLSIIKGYVETLVDNHQSMPLADRVHFLRTIQKHTDRLNTLLEDLLTLSRLESINPNLRRESISLAELLASLIDDIRGRTAAREHILSFAIDPAIGPVLIDPLKITQVCENLLDNAFKYCPRGSRIEITARSHHDEVELCVRDNGPGIPEADLPHIFERFYRVDKGRSREKGGTGLGLSIVKHIVQLHGGRVWAESDPGKGTAFFFTLPYHVN